MMVTVVFGKSLCGGRLTECRVPCLIPSKKAIRRKAPPHTHKHTSPLKNNNKNLHLRRKLFTKRFFFYNKKKQSSLSIIKQINVDKMIGKRGNRAPWLLKIFPRNSLRYLESLLIILSHSSRIFAKSTIPHSPNNLFFFEKFFPRSGSFLPLSSSFVVVLFQCAFLIPLNVRFVERAATMQEPFRCE